MYVVHRASGVSTLLTFLVYLPSALPDVERGLGKSRETRQKRGRTAREGSRISPTAGLLCHLNRHHHAIHLDWPGGEGIDVETLGDRIEDLQRSLFK